MFRSSRSLHLRSALKALAQGDESIPMPSFSIHVLGRVPRLDGKFGRNITQTSTSIVPPMGQTVAPVELSHRVIKKTDVNDATLVSGALATPISPLQGGAELAAGPSKVSSTMFLGQSGEGIEEIEIVPCWGCNEW